MDIRINNYTINGIKQNHYEILNVPKTATPAQIKKAYHQLCLQYHPDKTNGDQNKAEFFKIINDVYNILSDIEKRKIYDTYLEDKDRTAIAQAEAARKERAKQQTIPYVKSAIANDNITELNDFLVKIGKFIFTNDLILIALQCKSINSLKWLFTNNLVNSSEPINLANGKFTYPIIEAIKISYLEGLEVLLDAGADINANKYNTSDLPIHAAILNSNHQIVDAILTKRKIRIDGIMIYTGLISEIPALIYAVQNRKFDLMRVLLKHGASVDIEDRYKKTALHYLIENHPSDFSSVVNLLQAGADINTPYTNIYTTKYALAEAVCHGSEQLISLLLNYSPPTLEILELAIRSSSARQDIKELLHNYRTVHDKKLAA